MSNTPGARAAFAVVVAVLLAYGGSLQVFFLSDDFSLIAEAEKGIFSRTETWYFRPTVAAYYFAHHALFGLHPLPYHLTLLALHVLNALLVRRILIRFALEEWAATAAALLFAVAPPNHENLYWIAGATEIIAAFWSLISFHLFLDALDAAADGEILRARRQYKIGLAAFIVAFGAKASAVTVPLLLFIAWVSSRPHKRQRLTQEGVGVFLLVFFDIVMGYMSLEQKKSISGEPYRMTVNFVASLAHLVWPFSSAGVLHALRRGEAPSAIAFLNGLFVLAAAGLVVYLSFLAARRKRSKRKVLAAWPFAAVAPYIALTGTNPRYLYMATAGAAGCLTLALEHWGARRPAAATGLILFLLTASVAYDKAKGEPFLSAGEEVREILDLFAPYERELRAGTPVYVRGLPGVTTDGVWIWASSPTLRDALRLRYGATGRVWLTQDAVAAEAPALYLDYVHRRLRYEPPSMMRIAGGGV